MNIVGAGALSAVEVAAITADISGLLQDPDMQTSVVFFSPSSSSMDPSSGTVSRSGDQDTITGWLSPLMESEIGEDSEYRVGDQCFLGMASDFTSAPNTDSNFRDGSTLYSVISVETAKFGSAVYYEVVGRPIN